MSNNNKKKATKNPYHHLSDDCIFQQLMGFYDTPDVKLKAFFNERALSLKRRSLMRIAKEVNLFWHKQKDKTPHTFVHKKLLMYLKTKKRHLQGI